MQTPEDVDILDGQAGNLKCDVIGNPRPEVTWTFNDKPIDRQRFEVTADGELVLTAVNQDDAGTYRCTASNTLGKITAAAQVRVLSKFSRTSFILSANFNFASSKCCSWHLAADNFD